MVIARVSITRVGLALAVIVAAAWVAPAWAQTAPERIDQVVREGMERSGIPGFAVAVTSADGVVHVRGFGDAGGGRRVTPRTPFVLGSASKSFTALAAMQLVDAGRLRLDAPVRRYVPEFRLADQAAADRITVCQVLRQTSGLPATAGGPIVKSVAEGSALEAVRELRDTKLSGNGFEYANANFILAGLIVERASGEPYGRYVARHIFAPLGMRQSFVTLSAARTAGLAVGHRYWFGVRAAHGPTLRAGIQPAGYLVSSAQDMARYLALYLNDGRAADGRRIVSSRGLQTMLTPGGAAVLGPWADHADARYAMGWYVGGPWSEPALLHPGRSPDSSSLIVILPRRGLAMVTLANAANQLAVPGYPAPIDRVERNAVDALVGDPVEAGTSLRRVYVYFDLALLALIAAAAWGCVRARTRPRRLVVAGLAAAAALLLAGPALTLGWGTLWLWQPDIAVALALLGGLLALNAGLRLAALRTPSRAPAGRQRSRPSAAADRQPSPASSR